MCYHYHHHYYYHYSLYYSQIEPERLVGIPPDCNRKVASSNPGRSGERIFFSRVNFVCCLFFSVCSSPVLPQWHVKDPGHSVKCAGGRLHLTMHTLFTQRSRSGLTMPPCRHSVGPHQRTNSLATRQRTLGHSRLSSLSRHGLTLTQESGISAHELISTFKQKRRRGMNGRTFSSQAGKKASTTPSPLEYNGQIF